MNGQAWAPETMIFVIIKSDARQFYLICFLSSFFDSWPKSGVSLMKLEIALDASDSSFLIQNYSELLR